MTAGGVGGKIDFSSILMINKPSEYEARLLVHKREICFWHVSAERRTLCSMATHILPHELEGEVDSTNASGTQALTLQKKP